MRRISGKQRAAGCCLLSCAFLCACVSSSPRTTAGLRDPSYIHCRGQHGDYRISDRHRSLAKYSARTGGYVALCKDCTVAEWGDRIILHDRSGALVSLDRMSGDMLVRRGADRSSGRAGRTAQSSCKRAARMVPDAPESVTARAF